MSASTEVVAKVARPVATTGVVLPVNIELHGGVGMLTIVPMTTRQWWALKPEDRPGQYYYHPQTKQFFGMSFRKFEPGEVEKG